MFVSLGSSGLLGVEYLSAYLRRAGHRVSLVHDPALFNDRFDLNSPWLAEKLDVRHKVVARILELKPDVLAFSCITAVFKWSVEIAAAVLPSVNATLAEVTVATSLVPVMVIVTLPVPVPSRLVTVKVSVTIWPAVSSSCALLAV